MPRRAVPGLVRALSPANVKDPGGKMTVEFDVERDVLLPDQRGGEQVPSPGYPAKAAGISSDGLPQAADSALPGNESAEMSWPEPEEEDVEPKDEQQ